MAVCRSCDAEVGADARFCGHCGAPMALACVACGAELRPGMRFCEQCGASQVADVTAAVPSGGVPATLVTERKVTSVLFGDLVSFTTLSEQHDKEEVRELLSHYFAQCRRIVARYGGTVEKFIGDAVMAVWGVPTAHEDDAERAVRAGLELVREVESLGERLMLPALAMRVGIVTGEVAATIGAQHEGMVAGDAVNTAARVQSVAEPGEVWVDETTRLLTSGAITYVDVGSHELKGKAEPVPLWAVRAVVAAVGGAQRADGLEAPLTGRTRELRVIKELFHGAEESRRPALVLVTGDPGLGKSRLAWEFFKYIDGLNDTVIWHSTRCPAYGDAIAFWPIAEAVRGRLGLAEAIAEADAAATLDEWLREHVADRTEAAWLRARVLPLLGLTSPGGFDREDLFAAWQTFFVRAGNGDPVALVIDDAQHIDDGTVAFIEKVLANAEAPLFLLLLARPGLLQRWPDLVTNRRVTVLHLATLDDREMAALIDGLVNGLPDAVRDGLVARAHGVPLYAIETIRSLIDRDLVLPRGGVYVLADPTAVDLAAIGAPASLHALIAARLDQLPSDQRRVLADAGVLGPNFTREAIAALSTDVADLDAVLDVLTKAEILGTVNSRLSAEYGQYRFVQDIVRQVAYSTLSRRDRKARHLAVAAYFEAMSDASSEFAPIVAQHYLDAIAASAESDTDSPDLRARVASHLEAAASRARTLGAPADAVRYLDTALTNAADTDTAARLHLAAAWAAYEASQPDSVEAHASAAMKHFDGSGDALRAGEAAAVLALSLVENRADCTSALDIAVPRWSALHSVPGAEPALLQLAKAIARAHINLQDEDAVESAVTFVAAAESNGNKVDLADALNGLAVALLRRAPALAGTLLRAAAEVAHEAERPGEVARALMNLSLIVKQNDLAASNELLEAAAQESRKLGVEIAQVAFEAVNQTAVKIEMGEFDVANELLATIPLSVPAIELIVPWLDAWFAHVSGRPRRHPTPARESRTVDFENLIGNLAAADLYDAWYSGDRMTAAAKGVEAVDHLFLGGGLGDDLVHVWPAAVDAAIAAGDAEALAHLLRVIDEQPAGLVGTGFRAHRMRFTALLAARDAESDSVERAWRGAIAGFEQWGAPLYAARARIEFARRLEADGRRDESAELFEQGRSALERAGAHGWLSQLGLVHAPANVEG